MVSAYGVGVLSLDSDTYCALYINLPRIRLQRAWDTRAGYLMARSSKQLPASVYEAQAITPELAPIMQAKANRSQSNQNFLADMKAQLGF